MADPPTFRPFDPDGPLRMYVRNLPHWRQPGATYFVTFRQSDSIPQTVLAEWLDVRQRWYRAHHIDPRWQTSDQFRFVEAYQRIALEVRRAFEREQSRWLHEELDRCHGSCVLRHEVPQHELMQSLRHFHGERWWLGDHIVMPNHVHALVQPSDDWGLEDLLGSVKRWTSRRIGEWSATQPELVLPHGPVYARKRFWQQESHDRIVRGIDELDCFRRYIADNARQAGVPNGQFRYVAADWLDPYAPRPPAS